MRIDKILLTKWIAALTTIFASFGGGVGVGMGSSEGEAKDPTAFYPKEWEEKNLDYEILIENPTGSDSDGNDYCYLMKNPKSEVDSAYSECTHKEASKFPKGQTPKN